MIAAGYALSIAGGLAAVAVNELRIPDEIKETSGGMVAFGDMVLFVLAAGFLSLVPTWFLLKVFVHVADLPFGHLLHNRIHGLGLSTGRYRTRHDMR